MRHKVLVIDDEEIMRKILTSLLTEKDYEVEAVESAEKAFEWLGENLPDLVICDIQMQPMDGYSFLKKFRSGVYTENTPVIMLSGVEEKKDRVKCYRYGAQDFLSKPFNRDELYELISKNLDPIYYKHDQDNNHKGLNDNQQEKKQILVIDDDLTIRLILKHFLSKTYKVEALGDGRAALEWLERKAPPDLVICDIDMRPMKGDEFLEKFHQRGYTKHTPVIMLAGEERTQYRVDCYHRGAQDFLSKPFNPEELEEVIKKNLFPVNWSRKW